MDPRRFAERRLAKLESNLSIAETSEFKDVALRAILGQFPLMLDYWLQLIENSSDKESTWETALEACPYSLELWELFLDSPYGSTKESSERAINHVGCFFLGSGIWKRHLERTNNDQKAIKGAIRRQLYNYAEFYQLANDLKSESFDTLAAMAEIINDVSSKRWEFESKLKTQTFHLQPLSPDELSVWSEYLDYSESLVASLSSTEFESTLIGNCKQLYEKCLGTCALYPQFWNRYIRWLDSFNIPSADVYERALHYHPKNRGLRINYSKFLESQSEISIAREQLLQFSKELVAFDLRNKIEPTVKDAPYIIELIKLTGNTNLLTPELLISTPSLFKSNAIEPAKLFEAWQHGACPDSHHFAERLKETGQLEMFFKVDSTLD